MIIIIFPMNGRTEGYYYNNLSHDYYNIHHEQRPQDGRSDGHYYNNYDNPIHNGAQRPYHGRINANYYNPNPTGYYNNTSNLHRVAEQRPQSFSQPHDYLRRRN